VVSARLSDKLPINIWLSVGGCSYDEIVGVTVPLFC
jgi:hypothetical protein